MTGQEKKEMRELARSLDLYRDQLLARHDKEPLKSPPLFLLTSVINQLRRLGGEI